MMNIALTAWFYTLIVAGTALFLGLFGLQVRQQIRTGQKVFTRYTIEYGVVVTFTVILFWTIGAMMNIASPEVTLIFFGICAPWLASMLYWIWDSQKQEMTTLVIKNTEEVRRYVGEAVSE